MSSRKVLEQREAGIALKAQAVLFRASHHSGPLEIELTRRNIPFVKFGGLKFLEAAHVKDVLAFLRWAENPRDRVAGFRVVQLLPGVGPATAGAASRSGHDWRGPAAGRRQHSLRRRRAADALAGVRRTRSRLVHGSDRRLAGRARPRLPLVRAASGTHP